MSTTDAHGRTLVQRVRHGALWSMGGHIGAVILRLGTNLLLAHLLAPAMFGVAALGQMVLSGLNMFSDLGLRPYLVQSPKGDQPAVINTLWTLQASRGLLVALLTAVAGLLLWLLQHFVLLPADVAYANPWLPGILLALAVIPAIGGLESTRTAEAQRRVHLAGLTRIGLYAQVTSLATLVGLAYAYRSIWAIPASGIVSIITFTVLSHVLLEGVRNRFELHREYLPEILHFGRWIFLSSVVSFFASNLDRLILGGVVSARELGVYSIAATAIALIADGLGRLMNDLALPTFSEVFRQRPQDLRRVHYRFRRPFEILCFTAAGGLAACGESLVHFLYDARYADAGWMLAIVAWTLPAQRYRITNQALMATGDSRGQFQLSLASVLATLACAGGGLYLGGLRGFLFGLVLAPLLASTVTLWRGVERGLIDWIEEVRWVPMVLPGYALGMVAAWVIDALPRIH